MKGPEGTVYLRYQQKVQSVGVPGKKHENHEAFLVL